MLFIGLPSHNEATTVGVLLWRLRTVLAEVSREYEVIVYDDASTDGTADVLAPYARVLPLTLLRGERRLGTAGAMDAIVRHVVRTTRYPRRDGLLFMQADFTDAPTIVPEFLRRFEGGADLIIGERRTPGDAPQSVRRLMTASRWVLRPFVGISDVRDLTTSFRLARVAVLRDLLKATNDAPVCSGEGWAAQAEFLLNAAPHARRIETIPVTPSFAVRTRETRRQAWPDTVALLRWAWQHRGLRIAAKVIARDVETANEPTEVAEAIEEDRLARAERAERAEARRESGARDAGPRGETGGRRRERTRDGGRAARRGEDGEERRGARGSDETPRAPRSDEAVARAGRGDDEGRRRSRKERTPRARAARGEAPIGPDGVAASALEGAEAGTAPARADRSEPVAPDGVTADASGGAETEEGRRRRRRRSRRSRGGGTGEERLDAEPLADGAGAADGLSSAPDQGRGAEMREPGVARDDDADDASDEGSEGTRRRRRARRGRRRGRGDGDVTDASGSAEAGGGDETDRDVADRDDTADGTDEGGRAEARRRRGRRGRRGGRRRAGSEGGDGGGEATGGADGEPGGAPSADRGDQ